MWQKINTTFAPGNIWGNGCVDTKLFAECRTEIPLPNGIGLAIDPLEEMERPWKIRGKLQ